MAFQGASGQGQSDALHAACTGPGFFYLANHGVARDSERALFELARRFFELPLEAKLKIEKVHSAQFRGYARVGQEQSEGSSDLREQLDIGRELPASTLRAGEPLYLRLRGPNVWPSDVPELRAAVLAWTAALDRVAVAVTRALAVALGQSPGDLDTAFLPDPEDASGVYREATPRAGTLVANIGEMFEVATGLLPGHAASPAKPRSRGRA